MLSEIIRNIPFRTPNGAQNDPPGDPNGPPRGQILTSVPFAARGDLEFHWRDPPLLPWPMFLKPPGTPGSNAARAARATPPHPLDTFQVAYAPTSARLILRIELP